MSQSDRDGPHKKRAKKSVSRKKTRPYRESLRDQLGGANECLDMVREKLEQLGTDMKATPPMFYPEAVEATVFRSCKMVVDGALIFDPSRKSFKRADGKTLSGKAEP